MLRSESRCRCRFSGAEEHSPPTRTQTLREMLAHTYTQTRKQNQANIVNNRLYRVAHTACSCDVVRARGLLSPHHHRILTLHAHNERCGRLQNGSTTAAVAVDLWGAFSSNSITIHQHTRALPKCLKISASDYLSRTAAVYTRTFVKSSVNATRATLLQMYAHTHNTPLYCFHFSAHAGILRARTRECGVLSNKRGVKVGGKWVAILCDGVWWQ